jgi:hypothetical protein
MWIESGFGVCLGGAYACANRSLCYATAAASPRRASQYRLHGALSGAGKQPGKTLPGFLAMVASIVAPSRKPHTCTAPAFIR